jgi:hypothetical protein
MKAGRDALPFYLGFAEHDELRFFDVLPVTEPPASSFAALRVALKQLTLARQLQRLSSLPR